MLSSEDYSRAIRKNVIDLLELYGSKIIYGFCCILNLAMQGAWGFLLVITYIANPR